MTNSSDRVCHDFVEPSESSIERRRALGIYYTSRSAASVLARWAIRASTDRVLEPSFGGCTILEAALAQLATVGCSRPANQLAGFDIDNTAFQYLRKLGITNPEKRFKQVDFLTTRPSKYTANVVVANPPFVAHHRMTVTQRCAVTTWRREYHPVFSMKASLWAYFLVHSLAYLEPGGRIAFVLPSASTSSDYAKPLMDWLSRQFEHMSLFRMNEPQFLQAGAEERTVILLAEGFSTTSRPLRPVREQVIRGLADLATVVENLLEDTSSATTIFGRNDAKSVATGLVDETRTSGFSALGSMASTRIGEVVGDVNFFVRHHHAWRDFSISPDYLVPILTSARQLSGLKVGRKEVHDEMGSVPRLLCLPTGCNDRNVLEYLNRYPSDEKTANRTFQKREPWFIPSYETDATAFVSPLSHTSPRVVWNSARISCTNSLYKVILNESCGWGSLLTVAALTTPFRLSAELVGRVRGSGALKLEPADVGKLLVPTFPPKFVASEIRALQSRLALLVKKGEYEAATQQADHALLIQTGLVDTRHLARLRRSLQDLRAQRLPNWR